MPLTTIGIAHQIVSSVKTYKVEKLGSVNDCKLVVNHLIRKFSEPLSKSDKHKVYRSKSAFHPEKTLKEHLLPVNEIMNHLIEMDFTRNHLELALEIERYLTEALVIVVITDRENQKLNACGLQKNMPLSYRDPKSTLYADPWARYKHVEIYLEIEIPENNI